MQARGGIPSSGFFTYLSTAREPRLFPQKPQKGETSRSHKGSGGQPPSGARAEKGPCAPPARPLRQASCGPHSAASASPARASLPLPFPLTLVYLLHCLAQPQPPSSPNDKHPTLTVTSAATCGEGRGTHAGEAGGGTSMKTGVSSAPQAEVVAGAAAASPLRTPTASGRPAPFAGAAASQKQPAPHAALAPPRPASRTRNRLPLVRPTPLACPVPVRARPPSIVIIRPPTPSSSRRACLPATPPPPVSTPAFKAPESAPLSS